MPGAPLRKSTSRPESSAIAGSPVWADALRALMMAFSTKVVPVSGGSGRPSDPAEMPDETYPLVLILHGHGANPENHAYDQQAQNGAGW